MGSISDFSFINNHFSNPDLSHQLSQNGFNFYDEVLLDLAKDRSIETLTFCEYVRMITELACYALNVERSSIWLFDKREQNIVCIDMYSQSDHKHQAGGSISKAKNPAYFDYIHEERILAAEEAQTFSGTAELAKNYLIPNNITSMLDVPLRRGGELIGVLCNEHTGKPRRWTHEEEYFVSSLSDIVSKAIEIAKRREAERQLRKTNKELIRSNKEFIKAKKIAEKSNRAKTEFLTNMSHEIRTPMSVILGFTDLLRKTSLATNNETQEYLDIIENSGRKLLSIIDDLLDLTRVETGKLHLHPHEFNFKSFMRNLENSVHIIDKTKPLKITFESKSNTPESIYTDPCKLNQILTNIIGNAIKFTERGEIKIKYWAEEKSENETLLKFNIQDSGRGISKQQQRVIFKKFGQADPSLSRSFGGLGVGLALSRRLARALGGDVILKRSEIGRGSEFEVTIKVDPNLSQGQEKSLPHINPKKLHILSVDDSPEMQYLVKAFLESELIEVESVNNGDDAIDRALHNEYDLVLMDVQMPGKDGFETTKELRAQHFEKPIIALTAHAMKKERDNCLAAGFDDFLTKPIDKDELLSKVHSMTH